jgi:hypothetical protein
MTDGEWGAKIQVPTTKLQRNFKYQSENIPLSFDCAAGWKIFFNKCRNFKRIFEICALFGSRILLMHD